MSSDERVRWACRRGLLELDLFLVPFFEKIYPTLTLAEKETFSQLLSENDPQLLAYLMAHEFPQNKDVTALVEKIRYFRLQHIKNPFL